MCAPARHDRKLRQVVTLADGEVVGVVRGRDLDGAGAELGVGPVVGDDGDFAVWLPAAALSGSFKRLADESGW